MNMRLFFLTNEGWFEAAVNGKLLNASIDEWIAWAYAMAAKYNYRNYLITENPCYSPGKPVGTMPAYAAVL